MKCGLRFWTMLVLTGSMIAGLGSVPSAHPASPHYSFTTIDVSGAGGTIAQGINNLGTIVGLSFDNSGWTLKHGVFTPFYVTGSVFTEVNTLNDFGLAIGDYLGADDITHGFALYRGHRTDFDVPGSILTVPTGVSNRGEISGIYLTTSLHGFTLIHGQYATLDFPGVGVTDTFAFGNNDLGRIVGFYADGTGNHGFLKDGRKFRSFDYPGSTDTQPNDINNWGDIVGSFGDGSTRHGFLLRRGVFTSIDVPGSTFTRIFSINDSGRIVGWYMDASGDSHGFIGQPRL